jgi:ABC-type multidrug transport system fused ATPase/permease subunit
LKSKNLNRIGFISNNALRQILVSVFNMVIPLIVIRYCSKELWGSFVSLLLFSLLALQVINWGNKEYLLRQFSQFPGKINADYSRILFTRLPLVFIFGVVSFFYFSTAFGVFILLWIFGRFLNHSVEALIIYEKKFNSAIAIELGCFVVFCVFVYLMVPKLDLFLLLIIYSLYQFIKGLFYFLLFRHFFSSSDLSIDLKYYSRTFPFFLLSILGFLASKIDVYIIERLGDKIVTSDYQVINSLLVFTMSLSAFLYAPFTKNIYRNNEQVIRKTQRLIAVAGLAIVPVSLLSIYMILKFYVHLQLPLLFYFAALLYVYPSFVYGIKVVNLFKLHREKRVVLYLLAGTIANTILSALFLYFNYGITGALFGSAIAQLLVLTLFCFTDFENKTNHQKFKTYV